MLVTSNAAGESEVRTIDLSQRLSIHIVGIGGAGMRAIARVLLAMGHEVSGSDQAPSRFLDELAALGATVFVGHDAANIASTDLLTRSTAVPDDNPEVAAAIDGGHSVYSRAEILASICLVRPAILVAGTHGKTTTSSMLSVVLDHAGLAPSFVIGSDVDYFGTGARWGESDVFVVEADESDGTFLMLAGSHAIVTSLDPDHLEFYGSADRLWSAFEDFVDAVPGITAVCIDDHDTRALTSRPRAVTYGEHVDADVRLSKIVVERDQTRFEVASKGTPLGSATVGLPGHHNALNAAAAITIALELGVSFDTIAGGLAAFHGVARRMEQRGEARGARFVDDYAHLPAEVEVAVATAIAGGWNRIVAAYQPHRYSRTEELGATFAESFRGVDHLILTDIYPSGEEPRAGVTGRIVYEAVVAACPELSVSWQPTLDDVVDHLSAVVGPGDVCLTLGAGDLTTVADRVIERLEYDGVVDTDWLRDIEPNLTDSNVSYDVPIGPLTTYRVGGAARAVVEVGSRTDLTLLVDQAIATATPLLPIGKGSNLLVADRGFDGVALVLSGEFDELSIDQGVVRVGAAVSLPVAARQTVQRSLAGFEWAVGVPGSIGGAVAMNAGGHGSDMNANVVSATVIDLRTGEVTNRSNAELAFGYRTSSIAATDLVLDATIELATGERSQGEALLSEIVRWRREHQPGGQNAGSVFTNPEGDSAGRLIDAAGAKGSRHGSAHVSAKHANFIIVDPDGSADDVFALMRKVSASVYADSAVALHPETRLVGFPAFVETL